jgi:hypothetical protein
MNGNIGTSTSNSTSASGAISGSDSRSRSNSDQTQGQSSSTNQGQTQGQNQGQTTTLTPTQTNQQGQTASQGNSQGVAVSNTFNSAPDRKTHEVRTNNAVPLVSSSSFSSDYCGGSMSAGASGAPIGISLGFSKPIMDKSCQALRRSEKFGMAAVNALNMNQPELAGRLMSMMIWSICTSDSMGPAAGRSTSDACDKLALLGTLGSNGSLMPGRVDPRTNTTITDASGKISKQAAARSAQQSPAASTPVQSAQIAASSRP